MVVVVCGLWRGRELDFAVVGGAQDDGQTDRTSISLT